MRIYKIMAASEWVEAVRSGRYQGSADDRRDGFIHFSTRDQLAGTAARYFTGKTGQVLLAFDGDGFGPELKWEPSRGGMLFPHLYTDLDPRHALTVKRLMLDSEGLPVLPDGDI